MKKVKPTVRGYQPQYPSNPVTAALQKLFDKGQLELGMDERAYLADLLAEELCREMDKTSMGAAIARRLTTWIKGRERSDVD